MDSARRPLDPVEARILGVLIEKEMTTPDHYPLTLSGVVAGCNQSTNRDPVLTLDEGEVEKALVRLHDAGWATPVRRAGDRATKYRHKVAEMLEVDEQARAVLAVLLLRGAQTGGELRSRTERYVSFSTVQEVEDLIDALAEESLVERLPRLPGQSQRRIQEKLSEGSVPDTPAAEIVDLTPRLEERLSDLEARFQELLDRLGVDDL